MTMNDSIQRLVGFPIKVHIHVQRKDNRTIIIDYAKRIKQTDKKEYGLLKKTKKEFTFTTDDIMLGSKGERILYLYTKDMFAFHTLDFEEPKDNEGNALIKPVDMKKVGIYTDNIKRTYEDTRDINTWQAYLPIISIIIFAIAFVIIGNFTMEQINTVASSLNGVANALTQVAERTTTNCLNTAPVVVR